MNLRNFYGQITCDYAWELELFYKCRDFKDGIDFFNLDIHWDRYCGDHNPQFNFSLMLLNLTIFNFSIYNIWHIDNPNSPFYQKFLKDEGIFHDSDGPNYERDNCD